MKVLKREIKLCLICMEEHEVQTVEVLDTEEFKGLDVEFQSVYEYCQEADRFLEDEEMIRANSLAMKDSYRSAEGLLTSEEIVEIREQYKVSQKDFAKILGWGQATITRYENHQVQDRVHDDVLRKMKYDPQWFLQMLERAKETISTKAYEKYLNTANLSLGQLQNNYLIDSIRALYANLKDDQVTGRASLNLDKVVEIINYYAFKLPSLHTVKLMKMLWYGDALSFKRRGHSITGLAYKAFPMGAVPEGYRLIINLANVAYEEVFYPSGYSGYKFNSIDNFQVRELTEEELKILDVIIKEVGNLNAKEIISKMHKEDAYQNTEAGALIPFTLSKTLSID